MPSEQTDEGRREAARIKQAIADVAKKREDSVKRAIAEGDAKVRQMLDRAATCRVCGKPVITYGRTVHYMCEDPMMGARCICRRTDDDKSCTDKWYGDQGVCDPKCVPCAKRRGERYSKR